MTVEYARTHVVSKPWGSSDLRPWRDIGDGGVAVGEIWFERADPAALPTHLLMKLLFTTKPLSIQVHPDDAFARSKGLPNGKTEAWYILAAAPGAQVAVGLKASASDPELRAAIEDGSIADLVRWQPAARDDVILVPAGTIHALGAGLVVAEIQQRSDTTYRLFDFGRARALHVDDALAVSHALPASPRPAPWHLTEARTLLAASPYFVLERIRLPPGTAWELNATQESWLLVIEGQAQVGPVHAMVGEAVFLEGASARLSAGAAGMTGLLAYAAARPMAGLLESLDDRDAHLALDPFVPPPHSPLPAWAAGASEPRP